MSIADHFEHVPDAGFIRKYDSGSARRQFNVSLMLIAAIALAATGLGLIVRFDGPAAPTTMTPAAPPAFAGHL